MKFSWNILIFVCKINNLALENLSNKKPKLKRKPKIGKSKTLKAAQNGKCDSGTGTDGA